MVRIRGEIRRIIAEQSASLRSSRRFVDADFVRAVKTIFRCQGKVIVTGVGKSGLVAQKIASTLSSTGTPALYLHPVEGMHGSVGVVHKSDVVLAIGKSGESEELLDILPTLHKIGTPIIGLTGNKNSSLARQSTIVLDVPINKEVCPLNLAPTTSSTIAMVIGDAMAIALMKMRGFDKSAFAFYHPGGLLGKRLLLKVSDIMRGGKRNPVVRITDSMHRLLVEISHKWTGAASVVDKKGKLLGIVTDFDIRRAFAEGRLISTLRISDLMNKKPTTIYSDELAVKALEIMEARKKPLTILPVVDRKGRSVGMLHLHDLVSEGLTSA